MIMKKGYLFNKKKKKGVVLIFLDATQHQPSQPCIQKADHRARVDGDNWRMSLDRGNRTGEYSAEESGENNFWSENIC